MPLPQEVIGLSGMGGGGRSRYRTCLCRKTIAGAEKYAVSNI
jgi:hypothetical protein